MAVALIVVYESPRRERRKASFTVDPIIWSFDHLYWSYDQAMIEGLLGSVDAERVLLFMATREQAYGREIAFFWETHVHGIQRQLDKFESGGLLISSLVGRTRVYTWNPRWPFGEELRALLQKAVGFLPDDLRTRLSLDRRRPRRRGKPL